MRSFEIQRTQRLVQQQDLRLIDKTAGDGHALLLAAGHLADAAALKAFQAHDFQHIAHFAADGLFVHLFQAQTECHVFKDVQVREQRVFLEHRVHRPFIRRHACDVLSFEQDFAGVRFQKARDQAKGRGFTAAGRAQQRDKFLIVDIEVQSVQNPLAVKLHNDIPQGYDHRVVHMIPNPP